VGNRFLGTVKAFRLYVFYVGMETKKGFLRAQKNPFEAFVLASSGKPLSLNPPEGPGSVRYFALRREEATEF
jgi:hypothetical protein